MMPKRETCRIGVLLDLSRDLEPEMNLISKLIQINDSQIAQISVGLGYQGADKKKHYPFNVKTFLEKLRLSLISLILHIETLQNANPRVIPQSPNHFATDKSVNITAKKWPRGALKSDVMKEQLNEQEIIVALSEPSEYFFENLLPAQTLVYIKEPWSYPMSAVLRKDDNTDLTLVQYTRSEGSTFYKFSYATQNSLYKNRRVNHTRRVERLFYEVQNLVEGKINPRNSHKVITPNLEYQNYSTIQLLRYVAIKGVKAVKLYLNIPLTSIKNSTKWRIGYRRSFSLPSKIVSHETLTVSPNTYIADPFAIESNGSTFCFFEQYSEDDTKGKIASAQVNSQSSLNLGIVLEEDFHLSFPWIFEFKDRKFMCPESSAANDVRLYEATDFPFTWRFHSYIFRDISAVDSLIFEMNGRWWLFTNIDTSNSDEYNSELFAFYSNSPIASDWIPHTANPIKIGFEGGRNGGLFKIGAETYRVGQQKEFDKYGTGFTIFRIIDLQPNSFAEEEVWSSKGILDQFEFKHHFVVSGDICFFDYGLQSKGN